MNLTRQFFFRFLLASVCTIAATSGATKAHAQAVGTTVTVKGIVVSQSLDGEAVYLGKDSEIFPGDTITSAKKSFAVLDFIDGAKVVVRQDTVFVVEGYSYGEGKDESKLKLIEGGIRALTGAIARENPDNYRLETAVATLGVRGTRFDARICNDDCAEEEATSGNRQRALPSADSECVVRLRFEGTPPGGYFSVQEGRVFLQKNDTVLELGPGDVAFADDDRFGCLPTVPVFLFDKETPEPTQEDFREYSPLQCEA